MKKEELVAMGVSEEVAGKVVEAWNTEIKELVPKSRLDEVIAERDTAKKDVEDRDKQIDTIKKQSGDNETLNATIKTLQEENKAKEEQNKKDMELLKKQTAIKVAIASEAQDTDLVSGLYDLEKIVLDENGKVTQGLKEQTDTIRKEKPFLFREAKQNPYKPDNGSPAVKNPFAKDTFNLTEQGKLLKENPAQAKEYAAAAGIQI